MSLLEKSGAPTARQPEGLARKARGVLFFALLAALLVAVNLRAYRGYFQSDDLNTIGWVGMVSKLTYLEATLSPLFQPNNFRPVGHFFFREASLSFGLDYWKYVAAIQALHLLNVWLIWLLARKLGAPPLAAAGGAVLFAFHMALFDTFWKPMYAFDLLCAAFCLLSVLLYARGRWALSFVAFWLAYKSKELAVMLPFVLAAYEIWFGKRRWKPLIPFFLASLSFGLQGILLNPNRDNDYTFRFTAAAVARTFQFYSAKVFLWPYLFLLLPVGALAARNRRAWFGLVTMVLFFFPLMFLPGRLFSAYCYVPFLGLAIAFSGIAPTGKWIPAAAFLVAFAPLDAHVLATQRSVTLRQAIDTRYWLTSIVQFSRAHPFIDGAVFRGLPNGYSQAGCEGALRYIYHNHYLPVLPADDPQSPALLTRPGVAVLVWYDSARYLSIDLTGAAQPRQ
ncbi:MAG: hypothetical protein ABSH37_07295 [Bryobacteraceae bacterium]